MLRTPIIAVAFTALCLEQGGGPEAEKLKVVIDQLAKKDYSTAVKELQQMLVQSPGEAVYYYLGNAYYNNNKWDEAAGAYEDGIAKYPLSSRLAYGAALAYEKKYVIGRAIEHYRRAMALDPSGVHTTGGRYDPQFDALYLPVVHDHRGANSCMGRLYVRDDQMHFVVYMVASGWGPGNDDSFELPYSNVRLVEVDRKTGSQAVFDYGILTLLTNLSGPRRRIDIGEQVRVDLRFVTDKPIQGYRGKSWTKTEVKFFFIEPEGGEAFLKFLESKSIKTAKRED